METPPAKIISLTEIKSQSKYYTESLIIALCDDGKMYNQVIDRNERGWEIGKWYIHPTPVSLNTKPQ